MQKVIVLQGSPRKAGNTKQFSDHFTNELCQNGGIAVKEVWLYDLEIKPCLGCKACQLAPNRMGCIQYDDMEALFIQCIEADLIVISTPIYAFFAPAPVKAFLDRFIYAAGKYYGPRRFPSLVSGKHCAALITAGYPSEYAAAGFSDALEKICRHIKMDYLGFAFARDTGTGHPFMTDEKERLARSFAQTVRVKAFQR